MYATVFPAHQRIDSLARRHITALGLDATFPSYQHIVHYEGRNGPDATKYKKDGVEQPWHFVNPFDLKDDLLVKLIHEHFKALVKHLKDDAEESAAFEAAWLAHAIVDGLTPAHHYPYEQELEDLRGGEPHTSRKGILGRGMIKGKNLPDSIHKTFQVIGPKGLLTTHTMFEAGASLLLMPLRPSMLMPTVEQQTTMHEKGIEAYFIEQARAIATMGMYDQFYKTGWTHNLSQIVRRELLPRMVQTVTLAWYEAAVQAKLTRIAV